MVPPDTGPTQQPVALATKAIRGAFWTGSPFLLQMGIRVLFYSYLVTEVMGRFEAALLLVMFLALLSDLGLWSALIQQRRITDLHFSTAFWTCLCSGIVVAVLATRFGPHAIGYVRFGIGHLLATVGIEGAPGFTDQVAPDEYGPIVATLSLLLPCAAISGIFRARLQRDLRFRQIALAEVHASSADGCGDIGPVVDDKKLVLGAAEFGQLTSQG